jgi:hypothetical protein
MSSTKDWSMLSLKSFNSVSSIIKKRKKTGKKMKKTTLDLFSIITQGTGKEAKGSTKC